VSEALAKATMVQMWNLGAVPGLFRECCAQRHKPGLQYGGRKVMVRLLEDELQAASKHFRDDADGRSERAGLCAWLYEMDALRPTI
jgi:hypothetical protein